NKDHNIHPGSSLRQHSPSKASYPQYEARSAFDHLEFRHVNLLHEKAWAVDLDSVEALADENTVAMVIIIPGNLKF
ncbi:Glycine dehydrogenase (decarboxylating), partial [Parasponia andersonii]